MAMLTTTEPELADRPTRVDADLLKNWRLPDPTNASDKDERGRVLVVAGSNQMPGAVVLSATAAMRAGAGKLCIATAASVSAAVAIAVPEARVIALPETLSGGLRLQDDRVFPDAFDAILIGPGMQDEAATVQLTLALLKKYPTARFVLDTLSMSVVNASDIATAATHDASIVVTPHPGEMAHLTDQNKDQVTSDLHGTAKDASRRWGVAVALKSETTVIAHPNGQTWEHVGGNVGLATSGSGDVLAGIIAGLCARGAPIHQAAVWGVALHARSGEVLAQRIGAVGFLAREISVEVPRAMQQFAGE